MVVFPSLVYRSVLILKEFKNSYLISLSFIGHFENGIIKIINSKYRVNKDLINFNEVGKDNIKLLSLNECPLYYEDWEKVA